MSGAGRDGFARGFVVECEVGADGVARGVAPAPLSSGERGAIVAGCFAHYARELLLPLVDASRPGVLEVFGIPGGCVVAVPLGVERDALARFALAGIRARVVEL